MQVLRSNSALFWARKNAGGRCPLLIFSPLSGTPENAGVTEHFLPLVGPREGTGEVATSDFVPLVGDPRECRVYVAILPSFGPLKSMGEATTSDFCPLCLGPPRM